MRRSALRWFSFLFAVLVVGPLVGRLVSMPRGLDGSLHGAPMLSQTPIVGLGVAIGAVAIAGAYALLVARRLGIAAGMNSAGAIFGWCAWNAGATDALLRSWPYPKTLILLSIEAAAIGVAALLVVMMLVRNAADAESLRPTTPMRRGTAILCVLAACLFGAICVLIVAFQPLKGQAVFAAIAAAIVIGAVAQLATAQSGQYVPMLIPFSAVVLLAVLSPAAAVLWHGSNLIEASRAGRLIGLAVPHGFDWLCGAFFGIPVGVAWAESMMERRHPQAA